MFQKGTLSAKLLDLNEVMATDKKISYTVYSFNEGES
jgi:hypothetical protein